MGSPKRYPMRSWLYHAVCTEPEPHQLPPDWEQKYAAGQRAQDERFFARMPPFDVRDKSVLDYGCGIGETCILFAQQGARRVLGVDIDAGSVATANTTLTEHPNLADRVEFRQISDADDIGDERFDYVLSKNTFEHVADPARYVADMKSLLSPDGRLVIGFSPFWKSPYGGHIDFMTKLPWAHLLFPEEVILRERKRYRPEEDPTRFEEIRGGLNRMRPAQFEAIMRDSGLERTHYEINRNDRSIAKALNLFSGLPGIGEYFTFSVHSIWRVASGTNA
jgi:2-polyprenyl-3-methyl-5-hydroxy-6-metoxy-1,4-benzoquinol methylase